MKKYKNKPTFSLIWKISAPILFAFMPIFGAAQNPQKEKEEKKLEQAIQDLEKRKNRDICDSLYQVTNIDENSFCIPAPDGSSFRLCPDGDVEELTKRHIYTANVRMESLHHEASYPIMDKYPLSKFLTQVELNFINGDFKERIIYSIDNCRIADNYNGSIRNIDGGAYFWTCYTLMEFPLNAEQSVWSLENNIGMLNYLEHRPSETHHDPFTDEIYDTQVPNENPVVMMRDGKLLFTNPESQKLYEQYKNEMADVDKTHIFTNPELTARYLEYSAALKEAYEDREKLRQIGDFFTKKYQPQIDSLNYQLNQLKGNNR